MVVEVVGAVQPPAVVAVDDHAPRPVGRDPGDAAVEVLGEDHVPVRVDGDAVRADQPPVVVLTLVDRVQEVADGSVRGPLDDAVAGDVAEQQEPAVVVDPRRPLGEAEPAGQPPR